jgi:hypothetical protein
MDLVGLLMITQWTLSILMGGVPDLDSAPWEIAFHLAAEVSTAIVLILGSMAALRSISWSKQVLLLGLGMVLYSEIVSPGYFAQLSQWLFVVMFAILLFGAVWSGISLSKE